MKLTPARIALIYFVISLVWILISDKLLVGVYQSSNFEETLKTSIIKGTFFILLSALLIYVLINSYSKRLSQTRKDYELLLHSNPHPMWIFEVSTLKFIAVNEAAVNNYGYSEEDFLQMTILDMRPAEDHQPLLDIVPRPKVGPHSDIGIWKHLKKNGELIYVQVNSNNIRYRGKECRIISATDVTEQHKANLKIKELNKELSEYKHAIDAAAVVSVTDPDGNILHVNSNFERFSGYPLKDLIGKNHHIINSGFHPTEFFEKMWTTIKSGKVWRGLVRNKKKDGSFCWTDSSIIPILNPENAISHFICIRYDVTDRINSEIQVLDQNKQLREIAWISSHELRHPLSSMLGLLQLFDKENMGSREHELLINMLEESCNKLDNQIRAIVDRTYSTFEHETGELKSPKP